MTLKLNWVHAVVKAHVHAKYHQAKCSRSWVTLRTEKKNSNGNHRVRRYREDSNNVV